LNRFIAIVNSISEYSGKLVSYFIVLITLFIIYEIVARDILAKPQIWVHELSCFLFGAMFLLGGASTLLHGKHVNVI